MELPEVNQPNINTPKDKAPVWFQLSIGIFFLIILAFFSGLGEDNGSMSQYKNDLQMITVLKVLQAVAVIFVFILPVVLFSVIIRKEKLRFLRLNKFPPLPALFIGLIICIVALPVVSGTSVWNAGMHLPSFLSGVEQWMKVKESSANELIELFFADKSVSGLIINLVVVAFMAGLSEEIFFRGFLQRLFIENKMNAHVAVWLTAILFSAIHIQFFGFIPRMLLGAVLGYLYLYTENLWVPIIAHTVNNGFAVVMAFITGSIKDDPMSAEAGEPVNSQLFGLSALLVIGLIYLLYRNSKKQLKPAS